MEEAGAFFGMLDPLKRVYDYLKGVRETREVRNQLSDVLQSLNRFADSAQSAKKTGKALREKVKGLDPPIVLMDVTDLMSLSAEFNDGLRIFISSICEFGKECHDLFSGDFDAFLEKVKVRKPDVYDIMNFFGRNYDPNKKTMDLTRLPTLIRLYGSKGEWKENKRLSEEVSEGKKEVDDLMEKMKIIKTQRFAFRDRALAIRYIRSFQRLGREGKRILATKETTKELKQNAPSWYIELVGIADTVKRALPGGARPALQ